MPATGRRSDTETLAAIEESMQHVASFSDVDTSKIAREAAKRFEIDCDARNWFSSGILKLAHPKFIERFRIERRLKGFDDFLTHAGACPECRARIEALAENLGTFIGRLCNPSNAKPGKAS